MSELKKIILHIQGMHCASCDVLIKREFKKVAGVKDVVGDYRSSTAKIEYSGNLDTDALNNKIAEYGYHLAEANAVQYVEPLQKRVGEAVGIAIILGVLYFIAQNTGILPTFTATSLSLPAAFVLGLVASTSTCMATSGALFLATVGKINNQKGSVRQNLAPAISFNVGRVISYGTFGFAAGLVGKTIINLNFGSALTLIVSILMIIVGLDMLKIFSVTHLLGQSVSKQLFEKLEKRLSSNPRKTAFLLGAITYLLPCGFTMSVQLFALGLGNPVQSALMMMVFALGTVPALMVIGFASSFTRSTYYPLFMKTMGVLVFGIGLSYLANSVTSYGINTNVLSAFSTESSTPATTALLVDNGIQEIHMNVNASGYKPNKFSVKHGQKVRMLINGENVFGCQSTLKIPKYDIVKTLSLGQNVIEFIPKEKGIIPFSCIMGMFTGQVDVT